MKTNNRKNSVRPLHFKIDEKALSLWNHEMKRVAERGDFTLIEKSASDDIRLSSPLTVIGQS